LEPEHYEDLGVKSCKYPELPINATETALVNVVNTLKNMKQPPTTSERCKKVLLGFYI